ncbi:MAG: hypothetical protein KDC53_22230 [Saprospiraceae bacterium]|nr:hypothetical protein [Saprospiraceae bacterium]
MNRIIAVAFLFLSLSACFPKKQSMGESKNASAVQKDTMISANLYSDPKRYAEIQSNFRENNPGYNLEFFLQTNHIEPAQQPRIVFVQKGGGTASIQESEHSKISVGDIILLDPENQLKVDSLVDLLVFTTPSAPPDSIPRFVRPDWDMNITDIPGGCATENNAYRRILLTWLGHVGKYLYQSLNAHRVRITDSFTHYHPKNHGFDEFYLVQMVQPGAAIITGNRHDLIENPDLIDEAVAKNLLQKTELKVGDLVYLPRGVVHRGVGGVLAQVITIPGFIPGAEIGVDHHLKNINQQFNLTGKDSLPYYALGGDTILIK